MLPVIQIGPLSIQAPGLILAVFFWIGLNLADKNSSIYGITPGVIDRLAIIGLVSGIIGARLAYFLLYPEAFTGNLYNILSLSSNLLDASGGILAGTLACLIHCQKNNLNIWQILDGLTPGLAIFMIGLALANLASGSGYGTPSQVPWAIELWGQYRHPSQVYQLIASCFIALAIWPAWSQVICWNKKVYKRGTVFLVFIALNSAGRILLETFRGDSTIFFSTFRTAQVISWLILAAALHFLDKSQLSDVDKNGNN